MDYRLDPLWLKLGMMNAQGVQALAPLMQMMQQQMGMQADMASRVIEEYRKFLFLAMRAGHQVVPPGIINDVWMMHMQNVQNYWEQLGQVIGETTPTSRAETRAMTGIGDAWTATLESYERIFGTEPPRDIWGRGPAGSDDPVSRWMHVLRRMFGIPG